MSGDVARLRKEVSERAMAADLAALSEEVSRLKVAEATVQVTKPAPAANTRPQQQKVPEHVQAPTRITLVYDSLRPLEGVIAYLTGKYGGNVQEKGVVEVTASTFCFCKPKNAAELGTDSCFFSKDDPDSWLCYDFKEWRVTPTSYSIRTANWHFPKSWVLEVSNDGSDGSWDVVDRRDDNHDNNDKRVTHNFPLSAPRLAIRGFRFVRLRQTGANHDGHHNLALTSLEIFGILLSKLDTS